MSAAETLHLLYTPEYVLYSVLVPTAPHSTLLVMLAFLGGNAKPDPKRQNVDAVRKVFHSAKIRKW